MITDAAKEANTTISITRRTRADLQTIAARKRWSLRVAAEEVARDYLRRLKRERDIARDN